MQIDISVASVQDINSSLDLNSPEYVSFIESMTATFVAEGYELSNNPDWTHKSNKGSESWYYTFLKVDRDTEVIVKVVINVRVSDHVAPDKPWSTQEALRKRYVDNLGSEVAESFNQRKKPFTAAINVVIDGKHLKSLYAAVFYVKEQLEEIEEALESL